MKVLKTLLTGIFVILALLLLGGLFIDGNYSVERETTVNRPVGQVYNYILFLKNQDNFSVWAKMDPDMKKEFQGTDGTVGFISGWESTNQDVGKGEQEIVAIDPGKRIDYELRFKEPFESTDDAFISTTPLDNRSTLVTWGFKGEMAYPMNLMLFIMDMEEMLGSQLQEGLNNLKSILEKEE